MSAYAVTICHVFHDTLCLFQFLSDIFYLRMSTWPMYYSEVLRELPKRCLKAQMRDREREHSVTFVELFIKYACLVKFRDLDTIIPVSNL